MVSNCYSTETKEQPVQNELELHEVFEYLEQPNPEQWPYSSFDLTRLLKKWANKVSVDLAAHAPPKMACFIGSFWRIFGMDDEYKSQTFRLLNRLLFDVWFKPMLPIVNVNAGYIFQLTKQEQ